MNTRAFTLALIISIFAMFMVYTYIEDRENVLVEKYGKPVTVVVAKVDIKELELIDDSKVTVKSVPQTFAAPGHFKTMKDLDDGLIATVPILKGEQVTKPRVTFPGMRTGLAHTVSNGKRAVAITITEKQAVSKLLKPGDKVDIIAAIDYSAGRKDMQKVMTILQDVHVLSTGMNMTNNIPLIGMKTPKVIRKMNLSTYSQYNTVTMELDPYQVQKLVFLLTFTGIPPYLSLRAKSDNKVVRIKPTKIFDLLGEDASEAKAFFSDKYSKKGAR